KINEASLDEYSVVTKVAPANIYDSDFTAPFIYSVLSENYRIISVRGHTLDFDHNAREDYVDEGKLPKYERAGSVVCGISVKGNPIVVDLNNEFWEVGDAQTTRLGNIYELCGIDQLSAPVEYAHVKVFNKEIPVGVYLSYYIGFNNLLKYLKASYRVVAPRKQKDLKPYEYAVTFRDGSYIFDRRERKNALILGGFTVLEKHLKRVD
ncbi:hypothetical protein ACPF8X_43785, partial [Streptomyces sp. G35A]